MKKHLFILLFLGFNLTTSCKQPSKTRPTETEIWKLGWRMIENAMEGNYAVAHLQFDTLQNLTDEMDEKYLLAGMEAQSKLGKEETVNKLLATLTEETLREICTRSYLANKTACAGLSDEKVENKSLQLEIIRMFVDDQAARDNMMEDIISKYHIDTAQISKKSNVDLDERNTNRLKEIFAEYGFPTRQLIGRDAMRGIFLIIQHADGDRAWQKSQLTNIEKAVKAGDLDGKSYAYLYDRIKINSGKKQRYGTQFANVDPINQTVELAEAEDLKNMDQRRREMGMMPIEMYTRLMLKNL